MTKELVDRAEQQAAIAKLGLRALSGIDIDTLQKESVATVAKILGLDAGELMGFEAARGTFRFMAGIGLDLDRVELAQAKGEKATLLEFALRSVQPVTSSDIQKDTRFAVSELLRGLGVVSSISAVVGGPDRAYGVLSGYSLARREFTQDEVKFIQGVANVLSEASKLVARFTALESSEFEFSRAFEYAATGFGLTTVQGQWVRVNRSLCRILGYTADELLAMNWRDVTYAEDLDADEDAKQKLLLGEIEVFHREKRYVHKLGHIIWIQLSISLVRDKSGKPLHYVSQIQDISARKAGDIALRESNDLFRILAETMPQMVWMTRPDGEPTYANQLWIEYTGLTIETGSAEGWTKAFHPDELDRVKEAWSGALSSGKLYSFEARLRKRDGSFHWWLIRGLPLRDAEGKIFQWVGTCTDIDELKRALEQARVYESTIEEQSKLIHQARDAIILKDLDGRIKFWNEGAEKTYGWSAKEVIGKKSTDLFFDDAAQYLANIQSLLKEGYWEGRCFQKTRSGRKITVGTRWTLSHDSEGNPKSILSIGTDITELDKVQTQTFRAQRMESLGTLAGGIAHDLNNVLAPIMMSIELLKLGESSQEKLETLEIIETCSRRGAEMIQKVLSFARGVDGERNEIQPKSLIQEIEKIISDTFLKSIQIIVKTGPALWSVSGDTTQLHQVLLNLCVNARDAMPDGGILTLSAENVTLDEQSSVLRDGCAPGTYVLIGVEDTGMGMPKEILERLFEPFFTTKEIGKGTGLGLSTSLSIVKSHGGFIRVYSDEGRGTRFNVYLPTLLKNASLPAAAAAAAEQLPRGSGEWILVIDDEVAVRKITRQTLEAFGYRVSIASSGAEAIEIYTKQRDNISLVISDMMMPLMDGVTTIKELRKIRPDILVLAASGLSSKVGLAGEEHFLAKPFTAETLLQAVRKTLDANRDRGTSLRS